MNNNKKQKCRFNCPASNNIGCRSYVNLKEELLELIDMLRCLVYPEIFSGCGDWASGREDTAKALLMHLLDRVRPDFPDNAADADELLRRIPDIRRLLDTDVIAAYEGDPAATCCEEVMLAYPAFEAISMFRIAHEMYTMKIPLLPRMMTEHAHSLTGIDIHPGATVGTHFFIDHGTGVVIGETTTIGDHVKLYQGVTLGAKSFKVGEDGSLVKGNKRHPDIGSNVVIYSGATILGGSTVIGDNCVIGGNVWLTHSVEPGKSVLAAHEQTLSIDRT